MIEDFLGPYIYEAGWQAVKSPCARRKYGVAIVNKDGSVVYGHNERVTRCCNDLVCAREKYDVQHGQNTEMGAEIHAEQAALINWGKRASSDWYFLIAGSSKGGQLLGVQLYPCYVCARMVKYAGFKCIYLEREGDGKIIPISIEEVLEYREQEWLDVVNA